MDIKKGRFVLTGAPGCGKTTLINELVLMGYSAIHEVGRQIINEQLSMDGKILPWLDRVKFQLEVLNRRIILEKMVSGYVLFLDRGIPDGIAFFKLEGIRPPEELVTESQKCQYDKIFFIEILSEYKCDKIRQHSREEAELIQELIFDVYYELGYEIINIPSLSVNKRLKIILDTLHV